MDLFTTDPNKLQPWLDYFSKPATFYTITGVWNVIIWLIATIAHGFDYYKIGF